MRCVPVWAVLISVVAWTGCQSKKPETIKETSQSAEMHVVPAPEEPATERVEAEVGVGAKGRSLDNEDGVFTRGIVEPARSLFATRERMVFEVQIPKAMQLFHASEGRAPQSHEEFMQKIVQANNLQLPQLPPGQRYVYDPEQTELMVERPAR